MKLLLALAAAVAVSSCGDNYYPVSSPKYDIHIRGVSQLGAHDVDAAWEAAAQLTGTSPYRLSRAEIWAEFHSRPLADAFEPGMKFAGLANGTWVSVLVRQGCVLDAITPTVHEFLHVQLLLLGNDPDYGHRQPNWAGANQDFGECTTYEHPDD
jgi:hypothetical protein